jgi:hypothetical protein
VPTISSSSRSSARIASRNNSERLLEIAATKDGEKQLTRSPRKKHKSTMSSSKQPASKKKRENIVSSMRSRRIQQRKNKTEKQSKQVSKNMEAGDNLPIRHMATRLMVQRSSNSSKRTISDSSKRSATTL